MAPKSSSIAKKKPAKRSAHDAAIGQGSLCWAPNPQLAFVEARVYSLVGGGRAQLKEDGKSYGMPAVWEEDMCDLLIRSEDAEPVSNMDELPELHVAAVLANVEALYKKAQPGNPGCGWSSIYSQVGPVLIAMNPCKELPLYASDWVKQFRQQGLKGEIEWAWRTLGPHCFGTAEQAFQSLTKTRVQQSVVICGESGAGKTVTNRKMLEYLLDAESITMLEPTTPNTSKNSRRRSRVNTEAWAPTLCIDRVKIAEANVLLESFGNAKTVRNDNSSRFGKYSQLHFGGEHLDLIQGFSIEHYLLEKSRVTSEPPGERNYHIFHMLLASADESAKYGLDGGATKFKYTKESVANKVCQMDGSTFKNKEDFDELKDSMVKAGLSAELMAQSFSVVATVLHLGNIEFTGDHSKCTIKDNSKSSLEKVAELLGVKSDALEKWLCNEKRSAAGETFEKSFGVDAATAHRDSFARALYARSFDRLVNGINETLRERTSDHINNSAIGLLDIFGFEDMPENMLEQMYINLTNERIQNLFNKIMFERELEAYRREGIDKEFKGIPNNWPCIELFSRKTNPCGIVNLIKDASNVGNLNGEALVSKMNKEYKGSNHACAEYFVLCDPKNSKEKMKEKKLRWPNMPEIDFRVSFQIKHYAGTILYNATDFVARSVDRISPTLIQTLEGSTKPDMTSLICLAGKETIGEKFLRQLEALANQLETGNTLFVRCIKPNAKLRPGEFNRPMCLEQLTCGGVVKALEMRNAGFPDRLDYKAFLAEFGLLENRSKETGVEHMDPTDRTKRLLSMYYGDADEAGTGDSKYAFGTTKVFMKPGVLSRLRRLILLRRYRFTLLVQRRWRLKRGIQMIHDIELAQNTIKTLREGEYAKIPSLAAEIDKVATEVADLVQALETAKANHATLPPREAKTAIGKELANKLGPRVSKLPTVMRKVYDEERRIQERKEQAEAMLAEAIAEAGVSVQKMQTRLEEMEANCGSMESAPGGDAGKQLNDCRSAIAACRKRIEEVWRKELPEVEKKGPVGLNLAEKGDIADPAPGLKKIIDEVTELAKQAETSFETLMKARCGFDNVCKAEIDMLNEVRKLLDSLQAASRLLIADGFNGVGEAVQAAWQLESEVADKQRAACDPVGFKAKIAELQKAVQEAQHQVEAGKKYQERRAAEKERERHEQEKQEMEDLVSVVGALACKDRVNFSGKAMCKSIAEAIAEVSKKDPMSGAESKLHTTLLKLNDALELAGAAFDFDFDALKALDVDEDDDDDSKMWSVNCTAAIEDITIVPKGKARELPKDQCSSIRTAVEGLNARVFSAPEGYCLVYSASRDQHFLIYRKDCRNEAYALEEFGLKDADEDE
jgi:myosin heavy subunit